MHGKVTDKMTIASIDSAPPVTAPEPSNMTELAARRDWIIFAFLIAAMWIIPLSLGGFYLYLGTFIAIYAIGALSLQVMVGLAGQLSLGHAAFVGIGAYVTVLLQKNLAVPFPLAALAGTVASALAGLLMAQLVRLSGIYFKVATFGFGVIVYQIMTNWATMTGGHTGLRGIPPITFFAFDIKTRQELFVLVACTLTLVYFILVKLTQGSFGRALRAIGQNERAAQSVGIPTVRYRMIVIVIGSAIAGLGGSFLPQLLKFLNPESFTWHESLLFLIMIALGGFGSLPGAVIGAAILTILPEYLRDFAEYKMFVYGIVLLLAMMFMPKGLVGLFAGLWRKLPIHGARA